MSIYKGTVQKTYEKVFSGKTLFSFTLRGTKGFFRTGQTRPTFKEGGYISFEADDGLNVDVSTIESLSHKEPEITDSSKPVAAYVDREDFRQRSIIYQSARKDALEFLNIEMAQDALKLPSNMPKRRGALLAELDTLTMRFFGDTANLGHKDETEEMVEADSEDTDSE